MLLGDFSIHVEKNELTCSLYYSQKSVQHKFADPKVEGKIKILENDIGKSSHTYVLNKDFLGWRQDTNHTGKVLISWRSLKVVFSQKY